MAANWWYRRGGLGAVMLDEATGLEARGHEVIPFAASHPENLPSPWARFFPEFVETSEGGRHLPPLARVAAAADLIYDRHAAHAFDRLAEHVRPDLLHLHNPSRQLSPSILSIARRRGIPVVLTLHDYSLICPQGQLHKGQIAPCEPPNCVRGNVLHAVANQCVKRSTVLSGVAALEHLIHRATGAYTRNTTRFIAPSRFLRDLVAESGIGPGRISILPNGIDPGPEPRPLPSTGGHVLFAGRLAREKGIETIVRAAERLPGVPFMVAGDGPLKADIEPDAPKNLFLLGHCDAIALEVLREAAVVAVSPSTCNENAPLTVMEAMRAARPVVATDVGGQSELLASGGGILVSPGDATAFVRAVESLWGNRSEAAAIGGAGRQALVEHYSLDRHLDGLLAIYEGVTAQPSRRQVPPRTG